MANGLPTHLEIGSHLVCQRLCLLPAQRLLGVAQHCQQLAPVDGQIKLDAVGLQAGRGEAGQTAVSTAHRKKVKVVARPSASIPTHPASQPASQPATCAKCWLTANLRGKWPGRRASGPQL